MIELPTNKLRKPSVDVLNVCMFLMQKSSSGSGESSKATSAEGKTLYIILK